MFESYTVRSDCQSTISSTEMEVIPIFYKYIDDDADIYNCFELTVFERKEVILFDILKSW